MATYEVWGASDPADWTDLVLETDRLNEALSSAESLVTTAKFCWIAVFRHGKALWLDGPQAAPSG